MSVGLSLPLVKNLFPQLLIFISSGLAHFLGLVLRSQLDKQVLVHADRVTQFLLERATFARLLKPSPGVVEPSLDFEDVTQSAMTSYHQPLKSLRFFRA